MLVNLLVDLSAEEMMDTKMIAQRASVRLGIDLTSKKRVTQVESIVNQLLEYDSDATTEESSEEGDDSEEASWVVGWGGVDGYE